MYSFPIIVTESKKSKIICVDGYYINKNYGCYKEAKNSYVVVELNSGTCVKSNLKTLDEAYKYPKLIDLKKLEKAKQSKLYQTCVKAIESWKKDNK